MTNFRKGELVVYDPIENLTFDSQLTTDSCTGFTNLSGLATRRRVYNIQTGQEITDNNLPNEVVEVFTIRDKEGIIPEYVVQRMLRKCNITVNLTEDTSKTIELYTSGDEGETTTYTIQAPNNGTHSLSGSTLTYTPNNNFGI